MQAWLILWAGVLAIAAIAVLGLRTLRRKLQLQPRSESSASETPASAHVGAPTSLDALALAGRLEPVYEACAHPTDLLNHPEFEGGVVALSEPSVPLEQLINYCIGTNEELAAVAAEALRRRADGGAAVDRAVPFLIHANAWRAFFILRMLEKHAARPVLAAVLAQARGWWARNPMLPKILGDFAEHELAGSAPIDLAPALDAQAAADPDAIRAVLEVLSTPRAPRLREAFERWERTRLDRKFLQSVGRVWDAVDLATIVDHARLEAAVEAGVQAVEHDPPQSFVVSGEPGSGKTTVVRAIARRLMERGWTVFESSAADVLSGQVYIGQLEQRVKELQDNLHAARKVLWYVPQFHELYYGGRHRFSPQGILDLLLPAVEAGRLCIVGEVPPSAMQLLLQERPRVRLAFKELKLEPLSAEDSFALAERLIEREFAETGVTVHSAVTREALDLARSYLGGHALPGALIELLRATRSKIAPAAGGPITMRREDLLVTLSQLTGLPRSVLDEREGLHPIDLAAFFEQRVMGQPEAVSCLVDRIAMLKAGLTDPNRPIGVFLFAGPTGTGKTEVAKVLAQFLFGSQDRMLRLDMSELQDPSAVARVTGDIGESRGVQSLADRIRKQPFSVILLDEFEKAHPRVWDLFLQVFDDGRLTDAHGNPADFRHSIIILTSNLGATEHQAASLGFTSAGAAFGEAQILRSIGATFRPEFVNRLDRIVVFRPLSRAVMREILKKELKGVLQRRGFRSREWAVEWEESALEFLLDRGFTRDMGARPLRRAIEQYLLAPIAMSIVEHRSPQGDQFLFVRSDGGGIQVEFVDPDAAPAVQSAGEPEPKSTPAIALGSLILAARGHDEERRFLAGRLAALEERMASEQWNAGKAARLAQMQHAGFWSSPERYATLSRIELMDRIEAGLETARSIMRRLETRAERRNALPASLLSNLAQQIYLLEHALHDLDAQCASDVFLSIESVAGEGSGVRNDPTWPLILAGMYGQWGRKRRMRVQTLREGHPADAQIAVLAVSGFGAHGILHREAGLHVMEVPDASEAFQRLSARVRVAPQPAQPKPAAQSELDFALRCLAADAGSNTIVRRYRRLPSPLVRDALAGWRTGRLDQVLGGDFDVMA
jgi:ATP-dependent Clp protease ATP-binding subunit ClpC